MRNRLIPMLWLGAALALPAGAAAQGILAYPDLVYYKFNEGSGSSVVNWANPGISSYQPTWFNGVAGTYDTTSPMYGASAMNFAAVARLLTGYPTNLSGSFTIEAWIRTNTIQAPGCASTACQLNRLWGDYTSGMSLFRCYVGFYNTGANFLGGTLPTMNTSPGYVTDGTWHHVALVRDAVAMTYTSYIDGIVDQTVASPTPGASVATANFGLGGTGTATSTTGTPFNGAIDEFRFWGEARDQTQIIAGMLGELPETQTRAIFSANRRLGNAHMLVKFQDLSSAAPGATITGYAWDFGDLNQSTEQNPCHIYTTPGTYTVTLTVFDSNNVTDTLTLTNYITVGAEQFSAQTCGAGDLYLWAPQPLAAWNEGWTLVSVDTSGPVGSGWFFGLYPDPATWAFVSIPAAPGYPPHFVNVGNPGIWPEAAFTAPAGTLTSLAGLKMDVTVVYFDASYYLIGNTAVSRVQF